MLASVIQLFRLWRTVTSSPMSITFFMNIHSTIKYSRALRIERITSIAIILMNHPLNENHMLFSLQLSSTKWRSTANRLTREPLAMMHRLPPGRWMLDTNAFLHSIHGYECWWHLEEPSITALLGSSQLIYCC